MAMWELWKCHHHHHHHHQLIVFHPTRTYTRDNGLITTLLHVAPQGLLMQNFWFGKKTD